MEQFLAVCEVPVLSFLHCEAHFCQASVWYFRQSRYSECAQFKTCPYLAWPVKLPRPWRPVSGVRGRRVYQCGTQINQITPQERLIAWMPTAVSSPLFSRLGWEFYVLRQLFRFVDECTPLLRSGIGTPAAVCKVLAKRMNVRYLECVFKLVLATLAHSTNCLIKLTCPKWWKVKESSIFLS